MVAKKTAKKTAKKPPAKKATRKASSDPFIGKFVIIRGHDTGVFFGTLVLRRDAGPGRQEVVLSSGRRIWEWWGPETLSGVATVGVDVTKSKVESAPADKLALVADAEEIIVCSDAAIASIQSARFLR